MDEGNVINVVNLYNNTKPWIEKYTVRYRWIMFLPGQMNFTVKRLILSPNLFDSLFVRAYDSLFASFQRALAIRSRSCCPTRVILRPPASQGSATFMFLS